MTCLKLKSKILSVVFACTTFLASATLAADLSDFSGVWQGQGTVQNGIMVEASRGQFVLGIQLSEKELLIKDCWEAIGGGATRCYDNHFVVDSFGKIYSKGKAVGDIFPDKIVVYVGKSQVSELMKLTLSNQGTLRYHYVYANFDGGFAVRIAQLKKWRAEPVK